MRVRLKVDLRTSNEKFERGAIADCDMVPVALPDVPWETFYNLRIGDDILPVGQKSFEVQVNEKETKEEVAYNKERQKEFLFKKIKLARLIDDSIFPVIVMDKNDTVSTWFTMRDYGNEGIYKSSEIDFDIDEEFQEILSECGVWRIYSAFVQDYALNSNKPFVIIRRGGKTKTMELYDENNKLIGYVPVSRFGDAENTLLIGVAENYLTKGKMRFPDGVSLY